MDVGAVYVYSGWHIYIMCKCMLSKCGHIIMRASKDRWIDRYFYGIPWSWCMSHVYLHCCVFCCLLLDDWGWILSSWSVTWHEILRSSDGNIYVVSKVLHLWVQLKDVNFKLYRICMYTQFAAKDYVLYLLLNLCMLVDCGPAIIEVKGMVWGVFCSISVLYM